MKKERKALISLLLATGMILNTVFAVGATGEAPSEGDSTPNSGESAPAEGGSQPTDDIVLTFENEDTFERILGFANAFGYGKIFTSDSGQHTITFANSEALKVTEISMSDKGLTNISDFDQFAKFENLERLELSNFNSNTMNTIQDITVLGELTSLTSLSIANNQVSDISSLSNLTGLYGLNLSGNLITDISMLSGMPDLYYLDASDNNLQTVPTLSNVGNLQRVYLSNNNITDATGMYSFTKLSQIDLSTNEIRSLDDVFLSKGDLSAVTTINLESNKITDISKIGTLLEANQINVGNFIKLRDNNILDLTPMKDVSEYNVDVEGQNSTLITNETENIELPEYVSFAYASTLKGFDGFEEQSNEIFWAETFESVNCTSVDGYETISITDPDEPATIEIEGELYTYFTDDNFTGDNFAGDNNIITIEYREPTSSRPRPEDSSVSEDTPTSDNTNDEQINQASETIMFENTSLTTDVVAGTVSEKTMSERLEDEFTININISGGTDPGLRGLELFLPRIDHLWQDLKHSLTIGAGRITAGFDEIASTAVYGYEKSDVTFSILPTAPEVLTVSQQTVIGNNQAFEIDIVSGTTPITSFGEGFATFTLPITIIEGQKAEDMNVVHVSEDGHTEIMTSQIDPINLTASFKTNHLSTYMIASDEYIAELDTRNIFADVSADDWFYDSVYFTYEKDLMTGVSYDMFAPNDTATRAMIWTVLSRINGRELVELDVWYEAPRLWSMEYQISDGTNPTGSITREDLVTMLYRYIPKGEDSTVPMIASFIDGNEVSEYAVPAMEWAITNGILSGRPDNTLDPKGNATRAEIATIIMRYVEIG